MDHPDEAAAPTGPPHRPARVGLRLAVMVVVIFALASTTVLVRSKLAPEWTNAQDTGTAAALTGQSARLVDLIDAERGRAGCGVLRVDNALMVSAEAHAADMAARGYAGEIGPGGKGPQDRAAEAGYRGHAVEIIAAGIPTADEVFAQWTNPGNPASAAVVSKMSDCSRKSVGIGYRPGRAMSTFGPGIWAVDLGDQ